ncbi:Uncharacterised protein [Salmonella enterica subsp. enterica]|uniref:Uncharacterized protein n=1 Tax=Salmonella enterica I TaxID=59201 RepID=A0A379VIJ8_SALET|nr:Uncharacterised protein [Salmonella enterica subsp. enterica]
MTPLFKKYEQAKRSLRRLFSEGYRRRRCLFESTLEDFQIGKNFRFLDVIRRTDGQRLVQRIINATIVTRFRFHLFFHRNAVIVNIFQHTDGFVSGKTRLARHNVRFQAGFLLIDTVFHKRTFGAVNNKLRIVDFHQMAGFNDSLQIAIKQLRFKGVIRIRFITQATNIIRDMIRTAK